MVSSAYLRLLIFLRAILIPVTIVARKSLLEKLVSQNSRMYACYTTAAAAKSPQSCPTLCDPIDGSPPGSPSLGFSRQEHWSGLPFPSPMQESEKWKWSRSVVFDSSRPHGLQPTRLLHPWDFPVKNIGVGCHCLLWCMLYRLSFSSCVPKHTLCIHNSYSIMKVWLVLWKFVYFDLTW